MTSTAIVIANNVIDGWGAAVQLDAARDVAVVYNRGRRRNGCALQPPHAARSDGQRHLINAETPLVDFENRPRGAMPDVGARELAAPAVCAAIASQSLGAIANTSYAHR